LRTLNPKLYVLQKNIYRHIDFLPVYNYFKIIEGEFQYIVNTTNYDFEPTYKMIEACERINEQVEKALKQDGTKKKDIIHRCLRIEEQRQILKTCLIILAVKHDDDIANIVKSYGYKYSKETAEQDLMKLKGELHNLEQKIIELSKDIEQKGENISVFDAMSYLHKVYSVAYDPHKTSVSQFFSLMEHGKRND